jgi:Ala-tRNA(Pro) deacylase
LANDKDNKVKIIVDKRLYEAKSLTFHPMQNDALTEISTEDFKKFLKTIGKVETVVDFAQLKKGTI